MLIATEGRRARSSYGFEGLTGSMEQEKGEGEGKEEMDEEKKVVLYNCLVRSTEWGIGETVCCLC